jgi:uncharacterized protein YrrD
MRKGKSIEGLKVIGETDGADLGRVRDVVFDYETSRVLGVLLSERELFGLIDAQVVPWSYIRHIGPDSIVVGGREAVIKAGDDALIYAEMQRKNGLSGREIHTTDGQHIGAFSDIYFEEDGTIVGYEVSGGIFSDMSTGRRFMPIPESFTIGEDVAIVPPQVAHEMEAQKENEPGGLKATTASVGEKLSETYSNIASASVEKQKAFAVGKTASRDVVTPPEKTSDELHAAAHAERTGSVDNTAIIELNTPTMAGATDVSSTGEVVDGQVLVRKGETITQEHADRAEQAGILHQLLLSAGAGAASEAYASGTQAASGHAAGLQDKAEDAALGKTAGREVVSPDGTIIVAPGMVITGAVLEKARHYGKEREVIASAGVGSASETVSTGAATVKEGASNLWETVKQKTAELTGAAHDKKAEYDASAEQAKINNALGRPVTRVILDPQDHVILNTGDLITHRAIDAARAAGALDVLLDSVYTADPDITPEMLRASEPGEAALATQAEPSGGPITATVSPDQSAQDTPSQGLR